eukprot:8386594-Pyramimonas_sp.AAC.1
MHAHHVAQHARVMNAHHIILHGNAVAELIFSAKLRAALTLEVCRLVLTALGFGTRVWPQDRVRHLSLDAMIADGGAQCAAPLT